MTVRLYGCVCGHLRSPASSMGLESDAPVAFPVPFYVVDHAVGVAVFDRGLHRGLTESSDRYRAALASQGMQVELSPAETVSQRLRALRRGDVD